MKREIENLQDAVNSINITEAMQKEIIQKVKTATKRKKLRFSNMAAAAVIVAVLSGVFSVPVRAFVNSLMQERMEQVPKEELRALLDDLDDQKVGADGFTRAYTEEEKRKMGELVQKYLEGIFPEGELVQTESAEEAEILGFCFLVSNGTFYLPDRELTEEEMLQIIDFDAKRDFALAERYKEEYADEIAKQKERKEQKKAEVIENGGITEEEAMEIAEEWLIKIYGITGEGLKNNHYFRDDVTIADKTEFYQVNWTDFPNRTHYYFCIDVKDGSLARAFKSGGNMEKKIPAVTEADVLLPELKKKAVSFVEEQLQLTYEDAYYVYYSANDVLNEEINFIFVQEDNNTFVLTYYWNGVIRNLYKSKFSTYQEKYEEIKNNAEMVENHNNNREQTEIHLFFEKIENME
ncbi:MAG: hypothetical protein K2O32_10015 [Acetatifactor sp.]|nr:hypothetical protein [Acetatifactor sp.]